MAWIDIPWTDWTPTITQGSAVTKTIGYAKYSRTGPVVHLVMQVTMTAAGTAANAIVISGIPASVRPLDVLMGTILILDSGTAYYHGSAYYNATDDTRGLAYGAGNFMGINSPALTLASGDIIWLNCHYRV